MTAAPAKKFINSSGDVVAEMLEAVVVTDPERLTLLKSDHVLIHSACEDVKQR
jgi:hypothetical protein